MSQNSNPDPYWFPEWIQPVGIVLSAVLIFVFAYYYNENMKVEAAVAPQIGPVSAAIWPKFTDHSGGLFSVRDERFGRNNINDLRQAVGAYASSNHFRVIGYSEVQNGAMAREIVFTAMPEKLFLVGVK